MVEPNRRSHHKADHNGEGFATTESYATDVLLIADTAEENRHGTRSGGSETAPAEPLDVETVVRKLIALLSEQQP